MLIALISCNGELEEPGTSAVGGGIGGAYVYPGVGGAMVYPGVGGGMVYPGVGGAAIYPSAGGAVISSGLYGTIVITGTSIAGSASTDYRCNTPFSAGSKCNVYDNVPMTPGVAYYVNAGVGECVPTFYNACNSSQFASFQTVAACEALCGQKPSSPTCTLPVPTSGTPCYQAAERCIYDGSSLCLCSTFDCSYMACPVHPTIQGLPSSSCSDGLCVAESPLLVPASPVRRVCSCSSALWQCEDFY